MSKAFAAAFRGKASKRQKYLEQEDATLRACPSVAWADDHGTTALHAACQEGHTDCVVLLLRARAAVDCATHSGITPLMIACENGQPDR